uniref:Uncharacterized protein n=1 Tax=Desulfobacca acetoxidans TaxID=60893 RepID=A0A7V6A2M1_9BACT
MNSLKKIPSFFLKILFLGCLMGLLAAPAPAEEQTPKEKGTTPATTPAKPTVKPKMAPRPRSVPQAEKSLPAPAAVPEYQMKGVDDTVGGQEIRNKKGPEDK